MSVRARLEPTLGPRPAPAAKAAPAMDAAKAAPATDAATAAPAQGALTAAPATPAATAAQGTDAPAAPPTDALPTPRWPRPSGGPGPRLALPLSLLLHAAALGAVLGWVGRPLPPPPAQTSVEMVWDDAAGEQVSTEAEAPAPPAAPPAPAQPAAEPSPPAPPPAPPPAGPPPARATRRPAARAAARPAPPRARR
ncbi:hypothetical protein ACI6QG_18625, partial [Roseococcus sp. DSY-14]